MDTRNRQRIAMYKNKSKNADEMRKERAMKLTVDRKSRRAEEAFLRRNLEELPSKADKVAIIKDKLLKWKTEKKERERLLKLKARPPFVIGKVKHKVGSPFFNVVEPTSTDKRITRSQKKNQDHTEGLPRNCKFKAPAGIVPIPLSYSSTKGKVVSNKFEPEKSVKNCTDKVSDGNTISESKNIYAEACSSENVSSLTTMTKVVEKTLDSLNIAVENVLERDVKSFRVELDTEVGRLQTLCEQWTQLKDDSNLPDHVNDLIDLTVGQTKLLISKKLVQYRGLIDDSEADPSKVTCSDLQGFWDMVYMQVRDVNSKFEKLQTLKDNNWMEEDIKQSAVKKKIIPKRQIHKVNTAKSSIRSFIAAARNKTVSVSSPQKRKSGGVKTTSTPKSQPEKENKFKPKTPVEVRRMSQVLMKISSQAKELGTPKSQKRSDALLVDVSDQKNPRSVKFSGKEVQFNGDSPVSKVKIPSTPFIRHKLSGDSPVSKVKIPSTLVIHQELSDLDASLHDSNTQDTPKRAQSLRRSRRLNK